MAKSSGDPRPISEESIGCMDEVKKGKPRKFAMICKGNAVVSLIIYKKGSVEKYKKEAKEAGKGQFYFGAVDGKGMDIRFALARSDGFEEAPLKSSALKGFLEESAELKCKPYFEIVDTPPFALDKDDLLVARFLALQDRGIQSSEVHPDRAAEIQFLCLQIGNQLDQDQPDEATVNLDTLETLLNSLGNVSSPTTKPDDVSAAKLVEALKNLKPLLEKGVAEHPNRKAELITSFTQIRDEIKNKQLDQAQSHFDDLKKLLQSLVASPSVSTTENQTPVSESMALWKAKVAEWGSAIKSAIAANGPSAAEIRKLLDQASALSKPGGNITEAINRLTECHALAIAAPTEVDAGAQFNIRLKSLLNAIKAAIGTPPGDEAKALAGQAVSAAGKKDFTSANSILDRVQELLGNAAPSESDGPKPASSPGKTEKVGQPEDAPSDGLSSTRVVFTQARLLYDSARKQAQADLQRLIVAACAAFEKELNYEMIAAEIRKLSTALDGFDERLIDKLDEAYNAESQETETVFHGQAQSLVGEYQSFLAQNAKLLQTLDTNPFTPVQIGTLLRDALSNLATKLA